MLSYYAHGWMIGAIIGMFLFSNLFAWLLKFTTKRPFRWRIVWGAIYAALIGGIVSAFGEGEGGFQPRLANVAAIGPPMVLSYLYAGAIVLGFYYAIASFRSKPE